MSNPRVAIIYLPFWHNETFARSAFLSVAAQTYPKEDIELIVVNNRHPELGNFRGLKEITDPLRELPAIFFQYNDTNKGFAGGINDGICLALEHGADYVFLLNDDASMAPECIAKLVQVMEEDKTIGSAQPLIVLAQDIRKINTRGNAITFLGHGYSLGYLDDIASVPHNAVLDVAYASGAALMMRADLIRAHGVLLEDFFMYHEDLEYGLRLRSVGYKNVCVTSTLAYHKYEFVRSIKNYEWMIRGRFAVLLMYLKLRTLLLILPWLVAVEIGSFIFAVKGGWVAPTLRAYRYWLQPRSWMIWLAHRRHTQKARTVSDHALLTPMVGGIDFQGPQQQHWLVTRVGNPVLNAAHQTLLRAVRW